MTAIHTTSRQPDNYSSNRYISRQRPLGVEETGGGSNFSAADMCCGPKCDQSHMLLEIQQSIFALLCNRQKCDFH